MGENYYSFVNGQHTTQGGTHLSAFREAVAKVIKDFYGKNYEAVDIRQSIAAAISIKIMEPILSHKQKTKLGSQEIEPNGKSIRAFILDFLKEKLDNFLHRNLLLLIHWRKKSVSRNVSGKNYQVFKS